MGSSIIGRHPKPSLPATCFSTTKRVLDRLFPRLILHGMLNLGCQQIMCFLGKGRRVLTALLATRQADTDKLISLAA
jgi:hypothetical protein